MKNERGNQNYTARPKSMAVDKGWFSPVSTGELCPPTGLNPVHDCDGLPIHLSSVKYIGTQKITLSYRTAGADRRARGSQAWRGQPWESTISMAITPKAGWKK